MTDKAKWYVIHTYSGYENKVASNLEKTIETQGIGDLIHEAKVPTDTVVEIKDGKERCVERKIYPGYVFVKMVLTDQSWYIVRNIRGCTGFVGPSTKPVPLTDDEVAKMGIGSAVIEVPYGIGDNVRIIAGPFSDVIGSVQDINMDEKLVKVTLSMFGRETVAELDLGSVEPVI